MLITFELGLKLMLNLYSYVNVIWLVCVLTLTGLSPIFAIPKKDTTAKTSKTNKTKATERKPASQTKDSTKLTTKKPPTKPASKGTTKTPPVKTAVKAKPPTKKPVRKPTAKSSEEVPVSNPEKPIHFTGETEILMASPTGSDKLKGLLLEPMVLAPPTMNSNEPAEIAAASGGETHTVTVDANYVSEAEKQRQFHKTEYERKVAFLDDVEAKLKKKFVGWNKTIDQMMAAARAIELDPELINRPIVIPLLSFPGYGKTTLVQDFIDLMGWGPKFRQIDLKRNTVSLPTEQILSMGENANEVTTNFQGAILIEEGQNLKPQKYIKKSIEKKESKEKDPETDENGKAVKELSEVEQRERDHAVWWSILGNGMHQRQPKHEPLYYLRGFDALIEEHIQYTMDEIREQEKELPDLQKEVAPKKSKYEREKVRIEKEIAKIKKKDPDDDDGKIYELEQELEELKSEFDQANDEYEQKKADIEANISSIKQEIKANFRPLLEQMIEDQPGMLGARAHVSLKKLIEEFAKDPESFIADIRERTRFLRPDQTKVYKRMIVFLTANPEKIIQRIHEETGGMDVRPNRLRDISAKVGTKKAVAAWFHEIMGNRPGWDSRWQLNDWEFILPFSDEDWADLVTNQLKVYEEAYREKLIPQEIESKMKIGDTVHKLVFDAAVDPIQGPRVLVTNAGQILGDVVTRVRNDVIKMSPELRPKEVHVDYDNEKSALVASSPDKPGFKQELSVWIPPRVSDKPAETKALELQRLILHQAGHAAVGALMFGSLPTAISRRMGEGDLGISKMWNEPEIDLYNHKRSLMVTLLAGYAAEHMYGPASFVSPMARVDLPLVESLLYDILSDVSERDKLLNPQGGEDRDSYAKASQTATPSNAQEVQQGTPPGKDNLQNQNKPQIAASTEWDDVLMTDNLASRRAALGKTKGAEFLPENIADSPIFRSFLKDAAPDFRKAIENAFIIAQNALITNEAFFSALTEALKAKPELSTEEIKTIADQHLHFIVPTVKSGLLAAPVGEFNARNCSLSLALIAGGPQRSWKDLAWDTLTRWTMGKQYRLPNK